MKKNLLMIVFMLFGITAIAQNQWKTDLMHTSVNFEIMHSGISIVNGKFEKFDGKMISSKNDFTDAKINFTVQTNSINTSVEPRDNHLKSADFFEVEKYPEMKFVSTKMVKTQATNAYLLYGNLTIKNVTKPVIFNVTLGGRTKDQKGVEKVGFNAFTKINRLDYNVNYDPTGMGIAKDVLINLHLQLQNNK